MSLSKSSRTTSATQNLYKRVATSCHFSFSIVTEASCSAGEVPPNLPLCKCETQQKSIRLSQWHPAMRRQRRTGAAELTVSLDSHRPCCSTKRSTRIKSTSTPHGAMPESSAQLSGSAPAIRGTMRQELSCGGKYDIGKRTHPASLPACIGPVAPSATWY